METRTKEKICKQSYCIRLRVRPILSLTALLISFNWSSRALWSGGHEYIHKIRVVFSHTTFVRLSVPPLVVALNVNVNVNMYQSITATTTQQHGPTCAVSFVYFCGYLSMNDLLGMSNVK